MCAHQYFEAIEPHFRHKSTFISQINDILFTYNWITLRQPKSKIVLSKVI